MASIANVSAVAARPQKRKSPASTGDRRVGDPGLEPGTSSLSESSEGVTGDHERPPADSSALQMRLFDADRHGRP
jgi:hypothetical protein